MLTHPAAPDRGHGDGSPATTWSPTGPTVRCAIGVALQDAALDPKQTGREHMRAAGPALRPVEGRDRRQRVDELLELVDIGEAADRRIGAYSGGMKRRLDLAPRWCTSPRVLFLDEPTTGLDPLSRAALWEEVRRLDRNDGRDDLPHHPVPGGGRRSWPTESGSSTDGRIVAEGTPADLKAEIGRPTVEAVPTDGDQVERLEAVLSRFGTPFRRPAGAAAVRLADGTEELADVVRGLDHEGVRVADLKLHAPSLDDVFLAKTGRSLEGAGDDDGAEEDTGEHRATTRWPPKASDVGSDRHREIPSTGSLPGVAVGDPHGAAADRDRPPLVFPLFLLAINSSGLSAATDIPGFPTTSYLAFALAFPFMQGAIFSTNTAGTNVAQDIDTGFFNRLSLTPMSGPSLLVGQLTGVLLIGTLQAVAFLTAGLAAGVHIAAGPLGVVVLFALSLLIAAAFGAIGLFAALRTGSSEAVQGLFPLMFILLFLSSATMPRDLIAHDWYRTVATINPVSYLIEGLRSLVITGWDPEALALGFGAAAGIFVVALIGATLALRERMVRT